MDHLPLPQNPKHSIEEIPYLCTEETIYDGLGFLKFPERKGWASKGVFTRKAFDQTPECTSSFVQAWLWFGLGHEVLGPAFTPSKYVRQDSSSQQFLCTRGLVPSAKRWIQVQRRLSLNEQSKKCYHLKLCLQQTEQATMLLEGIDEYEGKLLEKVARAVLALGEFLVQTIKVAYPSEAQSLNDFHWDCIRAGGRKHYQKILADPGGQWCRSEPRKLGIQAHSIATLNYYTALEPPSWSRFEFLRKSHKQCTEDLCSAYSIDLKTYKTRHDSPEGYCFCCPSRVATRQIADVLRNGAIPILYVDDYSTSSSSYVRLRVEQRKPSTPYVAISHVWADGMGNPTANELPSCQLVKLQRLVAQLPMGHMNISSWEPNAHKFPKTSALEDDIEERLVIRNDDDAINAIANLFSGYCAILSKNTSFSRALAKFCYMELGQLDFKIPKVCLPVTGNRDLAIPQILRMVANSAKLVEATKRGIAMCEAAVQDPEFQRDMKALNSQIEKVEEAVDWLDDGSVLSQSYDGSLESTEDGHTAGLSKSTAGNGSIADELGTSASQVELALWIDTICCPVDGIDLEFRDAKTIAIQKLKQTYEEAEHVLVIDTYLESIDSSDHSDLELLMRIFVSGWTRRMWTLQEGVMAKRLWFQFADRAVELRPLFQKFHIHHELHEAALVYDVAMMVDQLVVWRGREGFLDRSGPMKLLNAMRCRSVSYPRDEVECVANLLDVNLSPFRLKERDPTMEDFWYQLRDGNIPASIIFWNAPRLLTPGFRWAPATFLGLRTRNSQTASELDTVPAELTDQGLAVKFPGFHLVEPLSEGLNFSHFHIYDEEEQWYCAQMNEASEDVSKRKDERKTETNSSGEASKTIGWSIILPARPKSSQVYHPKDEVYTSSHYSWCRGLYVSHTHQEGGTVFVRLRSSISIIHMTDSKVMVSQASQCSENIAAELLYIGSDCKEIDKEMLNRHIEEVVSLLKWHEVSPEKGVFGLVGESPSSADLEHFGLLVVEELAQKGIRVKEVPFCRSSVQAFQTADTQQWIID